jgi:leucyl/phenylalanyl-tRNA--protein transferase
MPVYLLSDEIVFPPPDFASREGLLAIGGDLCQERLIMAYSMGIFPWFSEAEPIMWWSPDPRLVLYPDELRISRSLQKTINKAPFQITLDQAFDQVIAECARVRRKRDEGTWIVPDMISAYCQLHASGYAHSVEAWQNDSLVGGLYGVSLGKCFFGESMFTHVANASKVAFVALVDHLKKLSFDLIDCQVTTEHLISFGARQIPRGVFLKQLKESLEKQTLKGKWMLPAPPA